MDKFKLRTALESLSAGKEIAVNFRGAQSALSGNFRVLATRTGRGKGGSRLVDLQAVSGGNIMTIGTPWNDKILNLTIEGNTVGSVSEADEIRVYPVSEAQQVALKEQFRSLLGDNGVGRKVRVSSTIEPEFNGLFTVNHAKLERGRYGQIHLFLTGESGNKIELWTYRHSTAIETFEIL